VLLPPRPPTALLPPTSLLQGLIASGLANVNLAFTAARTMANLATIPVAYLDAFLGNPVRIPVGFQGAVVFDETLVDLDLAPQLKNPIRYTERFADNTDEFVSGEFWQYDSSGLIAGDSYAKTFDGSNAAKANAALMAKATYQFEQLGLVPPSGMLTNVLNLLSTSPLGLQAIKWARDTIAKPAVVATETLNGLVDQAVPVVAATNVLGANVALADNIVGAISPTATAAMDRGLGASASADIVKMNNSAQTIINVEAMSVNAFKVFVNRSGAAVVGGGSI
jgi:hypothetical protein